MGMSIDAIETEIKSCLTIEGLRHIYNKYQTNQKQIHPLILKRKSELESVNGQLIDTTEITNDKNNGNGTDSK